MSGIGPALSIQDLRVFLQEWFCGCGSPDDAAATLMRILRAQHDSQYGPLQALAPDDGIYYLTLYSLDHFRLIEHGSSIAYAWLTDKGKAVLGALEREHAADGLESATDPCCIHGWSMEAGDEPDDHDCATSPEPDLGFDNHGHWRNPPEPTKAPVRRVATMSPALAARLVGLIGDAKAGDIALPVTAAGIAAALAAQAPSAAGPGTDTADQSSSNGRPSHPEAPC